MFTYFRPKLIIPLLFLLAILNSLMYAALGMVFVNLQLVFMQHGVSDTYEAEKWFWIGMCFLLAWVFFIIVFTEKATFGVIGVNMIARIRKELMEAILHKQINWFDREDRAPGVITGIMSADI